jgi:hypothetical protein
MLAAWLVPGTAGASGTAALAISTTQAATAFAAGTACLPAAAAATSLAHGVLKMLGFEKLKVAAIALVSLVTAGSLAFGVLEDEPLRFEQGLRGEIVTVTDAGAPGRPSRSGSRVRHAAEPRRRERREDLDRVRSGQDPKT